MGQTLVIKRTAFYLGIENGLFGLGIKVGLDTAFVMESIGVCQVPCRVLTR